MTNLGYLRPQVFLPTIIFVISWIIQTKWETHYVDWLFIKWYKIPSTYSKTIFAKVETPRWLTKYFPLEKLWLRDALHPSSRKKLWVCSLPTSKHGCPHYRHQSCGFHSTARRVKCKPQRRNEPRAVPALMPDGRGQCLDTCEHQHAFSYGLIETSGK